MNNANSVFEIGSISKVFTFTLLANAVLEQQVANHTSGLPRMPDNFAATVMMSPLNPFKSYDEVFLNKYLSDMLKLVTPLGEKCKCKGDVIKKEHFY